VVGMKPTRIAEAAANAVLEIRITKAPGRERRQFGRMEGPNAPAAIVDRKRYQTVEDLPGR
ncbi:MAG: hypothetical protein KDJ78_20995, partial [Rhodobacteraceae bacterium]|nr:hypothetical protein [Paracoccaceae bacterium]